MISCVAWQSLICCIWSLEELDILEEYTSETIQFSKYVFHTFSIQWGNLILHSTRVCLHSSLQQNFNDWKHFYDGCNILWEVLWNFLSNQTFKILLEMLGLYSTSDFSQVSTKNFQECHYHYTKSSFSIYFPKFFEMKLYFNCGRYHYIYKDFRRNPIYIKYYLTYFLLFVTNIIPAGMLI